MSGPTHANQQRQAQQAPLTQQEQQIIQQLQQQQIWDPAPGQTVEYRRMDHSALMIQQEQEDNQQLAAHAQAVLPAAQAQQAAPGAPVQALAPAEKSGKEIREEQRHTRAAQKYTPAGDYISYNMHEQINQFHRQQRNACGGKWEKKLRERQADPEELRGFLTLYDKQTPSAEKKRIDAANRALVNGFLSAAPAEHTAALRTCVKQVLNIRLTQDMLQSDYIKKHLPEMLAIHAKLVSLKKMFENPAHRNFFTQQLPQAQRVLLDYHLNELTSLQSLLQAELVCKGVNLDGSYEDSIRLIEIAARRQAKYRRELRLDIGITEQELVRQNHAQLQTATLRLQAQSDQAKRTPEFQSLGLTGYLNVQDARQLAEIRELIARSPAQYTANKPLFDRLYQLLFRTTDALGDTQLRLASVERVITDHGANSPFAQLCAEYVTQLRQHVAPQRRQRDNIVGLIRFLLGQQRELSDESRLLAAREQALAQVQRAEEDPQQEQADEALWASTPEALIARVQGRLNQLRFDQRPPQTANLSDKQFFIQGRSGDLTLPEINTLTTQIRNTLVSRYPLLHFQQNITGPDGTVIKGLAYLRMINNLVRLSYPQTDEQQIENMLVKLACGTHYRYLLDLPKRTPEQQAELDTYTPARIAELEQTFQQGIQELKQFHLTYLRRTQQKYGRLQSQLHPIDLIHRCGIEYFSDTCLQQDCNQLLDDGAKFFDFEHNAEDREYRALSHYIDCSALVTQGYFLADIHPDQAEFNPDPQSLQFFNQNNPTVRDAMRSETEVPGPHLNSAEMKAYEEILRRRYTGTQANLLFGRFSH